MYNGLCEKVKGCFYTKYKKMENKMKNLKLLLLAPALLLIAACTSNTDIESQRGTITGNTYTNEALGLSFAIPDSWVIEEHETIAALSDEDLENFTDLMVTASDGLTNVIIAFERDTILTRNQSATEVLDAASTELIDALGGGSYTDRTLRLGALSWDGREIEIEFMPGLMSLYVLALVNLEGDYSRVITITTATGGYSIDEVLDLFSNL